MQLITSTEHYKEHVTAFLQKAQKNLKEDGDLQPVAIFEGKKFGMEAHTASVPEPFLTPVIKAIMKTRPDVELVVYISLSVAVAKDKWERVRAPVKEHPDKKPVVRAEASHPDFGYLNLHAEIQRSGQVIDFSPIIQSRPVIEGGSDVILSGLWPKRKLNS